MIYTVTLNPAMDKTVFVDDFAIDEVNRAKDVRQDPGGKGINVSKTVQALGGSTTAVAVLGGSTGKAILDALTEMGIAALTFEAEGNTRTNTKIVDLARGTYTDVNEPGPQASEELISQLEVALGQGARPGDVVVLAGSLPAGAPAGTYARLVSACKASGAKVVLDADGEAMRLGIEAAPTLVKPNEVELAGIVGRELPDDAAIVAAARELIARGVEKVMVSMGGDGAIFVTAKKALRLRQPKVEVVSTVGAGDSVVAALVYAWDQGLGDERAARLSMATGAATVTRPGTEPARREDVNRLLEEVECTVIPEA